LDEKENADGEQSSANEREATAWLDGRRSLMALHESHGLSGEKLQSWCRERGLFAHNLASWKAVFCAVGKEAAPSGREVKTLKDENVKLKRELVRKEKALAEAAALLILQKKFRALWEDEE
jgi:hypothetical protein